MSENKVFCENCRNDVAYKVVDRQMTGTIKGAVYTYNGKEAVCAECGSIVYVPEFNDSNLKALYDVFREVNGIVSLAIIRAIPEKYAIHKRPLSLLLGWGEQTFTRYFDGDIPTKQYSDTLSRIYNDTIYYSELLEANKKNLKSDYVYKKSREAVDALLSHGTPEESKIDSVIRYLLSRCEDITPLALQKALYYIQGFYYAFYNTFLFTEDCQAWVHGPVYKEIYARYRDYHFDPIKEPTSFDASIFSSGEKSICDSVIKHICCYSGKVLECFTHNETPWLTTRGTLPINAPSDRTIEKSLIGNYFIAVKEKYNMVNPSDIEMYAQAMFKRG